ncbi:hypothetical protein RDI58_028798 [Solanum bulbocastanum]|uniref:Uncharacterized protein n=1 Tax=Solanum bulbocastanum TaxID=147425 RepID=A0AAN8XZ14_SOLBU
MWIDLRFLDHALPKFNNLKVLVLKLSGMQDVSLLGITPLIEASPYLQKLHIELEWAKTTISKKNKLYRKSVPINISKKSNIVVTLVVLLTRYLKLTLLEIV